MSTTSESKTITVYVTLPLPDAEDHRVLTFRRIPELSAKAAIEAGLAVDGNEFALTVGPLDSHWRSDTREYSSMLAGTTERSTLPEALADAEATLVRLLATLGYEVDFQ